MDQFWLLSFHDRVTLNSKTEDDVREGFKIKTSCRSNDTEKN